MYTTDGRSSTKKNRRVPECSQYPVGECAKRALRALITEINRLEDPSVCPTRSQFILRKDHARSFTMCFNEVFGLGVSYRPYNYKNMGRPCRHDDDCDPGDKCSVRTLTCVSLLVNATDKFLRCLIRLLIEKDFYTFSELSAGINGAPLYQSPPLIDDLVHAWKAGFPLPPYSLSDPYQITGAASIWSPGQCTATNSSCYWTSDAPRAFLFCLDQTQSL